MRLTVQCVVILGVLCLLLMTAMYLSTWWSWLLFFIVLAFTWSSLCFIVRLGRGIYRGLRRPRPGTFDSAEAVLQPVFDESFYRLHVHGQWPTSPVLFCVNCTNEPLEYLYFSLVAKHCPLTVVAKSIKRKGLEAKFFNSILDEESNYIGVSQEGGSFEQVRTKVRDHVVGRKRSIYFYPTQTKIPYQFVPFRTGMFRIAAELGIPVVPLVFSHLNSIRDRVVHLCIGTEKTSDRHEELVAHGEEFFRRKMRLLKAGRHPLEE